MARYTVHTADRVFVVEANSLHEATAYVRQTMGAPAYGATSDAFSGNGYPVTSSEFEDARLDFADQRAEARAAARAPQTTVGWLLGRK
jgi:hypothetical protein